MIKAREIRIELGKTQLEIATKALITQAYLSEIETGKTKPSLVVLERLSGALDVSMSKLLET